MKNPKFFTNKKTTPSLIESVIYLLFGCIAMLSHILTFYIVKSSIGLELFFDKIYNTLSLDIKFK